VLPAGPASLEDVVAWTLINSDDIQVFQTEADVALAESRFDPSLRAPEVTFAYGENDENRTRTDETRREQNARTTETITHITETRRSYSTERGSSVTDMEGTDWRVGLRIFPPNPFARAAQKSSALAVRKAAESDTEAAAAQLSGQAAELFIELLYLEADLAVVEKMADIYRGLRARAAVDLAEGRLTVEEDVRLSQQQLSIMSDYHRTFNRCETLRQELAALSGMPMDMLKLQKAGGALEQLDRERFSAARLQSVDVSKRADVQAAHWRRLAAEHARWEAQRRLMPWLSFVEVTYGERADSGDTYGSSYTEEREGRTERVDAFPWMQPVDTESWRSETSASSVEGSDADAQEWRVQAGVSIPIWGETWSDVAVRSAEYSHAVLREEAAVKRAHADVRAAVNLLRQVLRQRLRYTRESTVTASALKEGIRRLEADGNVSSYELARWKDQLYGHYRLLIRSQFDYRMAKLKVNRAIGRIIGDVKMAPDSAVPADTLPDAPPEK
jgi:outer membrane protein TolC